MINDIKIPTRGVTLKVWQLCDEAFAHAFTPEFSEFHKSRLREWTYNGRMAKSFWDDVRTLVLMWAEYDLINDATAATQFAKWKKAKMATADLLIACQNAGCDL